MNMSYSFRYVIACIVTSALLVVDVHGQELSLQLVQNRIVTSAYDELEAINEDYLVKKDMHHWRMFFLKETMLQGSIGLLLFKLFWMKQIFLR